MINNDGLFNGKYKIIKPLDKAMENTYLAEDIESSQRVLIKTRRFKNVSNWKILELFEREIDTIKNIHHQRIPKYIDSFTIENGQDTEYYLIREYIEGMTLKERIINNKPLTEELVRDFIQQMADVLKYLHDLHPPIIHRDINPSNIVVTASNDYYLIDFGAVKDILEYNPNNATIVGTYGFMPMEQTMGTSTTASDIYSLGMTSVFLLTGKNPSELGISRGKPDFTSCCDVSELFAQMLNLMIEPLMEDRLQVIDDVYNELRLIKIDKPNKIRHTKKKENNTSFANIQKKIKSDHQKNIQNSTIGKTKQYDPIYEKESSNRSNKINGAKGYIKEKWERDIPISQQNKHDDLVLKNDSDSVEDARESLHFNRLNENKNRNDNTLYETHYEQNRDPKSTPFLENDPVFLNQRIRRATYRDLEIFVDRVILPSGSKSIRVWKDFDSMTIRFDGSKGLKTNKRQSPVDSNMLAVPLITLLVIYIGMDISLFHFPILIFAMIPLLFSIMRNTAKSLTRNKNVIELKNNYLKVIKTQNGKSNSRILSYYEVEYIYSKAVNNKTKIILELKTGEIIELDSELSHEETEWIVKTCRKFIDIAVNVA